jgi:protein involved in polysaccharide export with SLBB domain
MTVVQALSSASGFTPFANLKKIYILCSENGRKEMLPVNLKDVVSRRNPEKDVRLKIGDTIIVPQGEKYLTSTSARVCHPFPASVHSSKLNRHGNGLPSAPAVN